MAMNLQEAKNIVAQWLTTIDKPLYVLPEDQSPEGMLYNLVHFLRDGPTFQRYESYMDHVALDYPNRPDVMKQTEKQNAEIAQWRAGEWYR